VEDLLRDFDLMQRGKNFVAVAKRVDRRTIAYESGGDSGGEST